MQNTRELSLVKNTYASNEVKDVEYFIYKGSKYVGAIFIGDTYMGSQWYAGIIVKNSQLKGTQYPVYLTHYYKSLSDLTLVLGSLVGD